MKRCSKCNKLIAFGTIKLGECWFCSSGCAADYRRAEVLRSVPPKSLVPYVADVYSGRCPLCKGPGPVDMHMSHYVYSAVIITRPSSRGTVCCMTCARKKHLGAALTCAALGWWAIPLGIFFTPFQIIRNLMALSTSRRRTVPSMALREHVAQSLIESGLFKIRPSHRCQRCGYDVRTQLKMGSPCCPECGEAIQSKAPSTFATGTARPIERENVAGTDETKTVDKGRDGRIPYDLN